MARLIDALRRVTQTDAVAALSPGKLSTKTFTLPEQIAENIAEAIVGGTHPPGSWIAEQELANTFGVSRGPIREALRLLEKEGLVQILPRRGTMVTKLSRKEVEQIFSIRAALMGLAGRESAEQRSEIMQEELMQSVPKLERLAQSQDGREFLRAAYHVSMLLARASNNERLFELILSMARLTLPLTRMALDIRENRRMWARNWMAVVDAIVAGDANSAEVAARRLVQQTGVQAAKFAPVDPAGAQSKHSPAAAS